MDMGKGNGNGNGTNKKDIIEELEDELRKERAKLSKKKRSKTIKSFPREHPHLLSLIGFILLFIALKFLWGVSWPACLIACISLAIHEYAHALAMIKKKVSLKGVLFIPFFGGLAVGGGAFRSAEDECYIALAGPLVGFITAIPVYFLWKMTGVPYLLTATYLILLLNIFNLTPVSPLDGGRVAKSILMSLKDKKLGFILWGVLIAVCLLYIYISKTTYSFMLVLIAVAAIWEISQEWRLYKHGQQPVRRLTKELRFKYGAFYISIALCGIIMLYLWIP
ncbi:metalloprotease [Patescibacteria group bacterium]